MAKKGRTLLVFADESRQTEDRYMVIGGVVVTQSYEKTILEKIREFREMKKYPWEFKWHKLSPSKLAEYRGFVDILFDCTEYIHFKAIVVDTTEYDRQMEDNELGYYKLIYQFLLHGFGQYLQPDDRWVIILDKRTTKYYKLSTLWAILNKGINKKYKVGKNLVRFIRPMDSKKHNLIQMSDVIIGAIGYEMNGYHLLPNASSAKIALAQHIARKVGLINLQQQTPKSKREFSIWQFHFNKRY